MSCSGISAGRAIAAGSSLCALLLTGCFGSGGSGDGGVDDPGDEAGGTWRAPRIHASAEEIGFGRITLGERSIRTLTIRNDGRAPLTLAGVDSRFVDGLSVDIDLVDPDGDGLPGLGVGASADIRMVFEGHSPGRQIGVLDIVSDAVNAPRLTVNLVAEAQHPRCLAAAPSALQFDAVPVQQAREAAITLAPCDPMLDTPDVVLERVRLTPDSDPAFEVLPPVLPTRVPPETTFGVRFAPDAEGVFRGTVLIESDDDERPSQMIAVSGAGTVNQCPQAVVEPDEIRAREGDRLRLDGQAAFDPDGLDGRPTGWRWTLLLAPPSSAAEVLEGGGPDDIRTPTAEVLLDAPGGYAFALTVADERGAPRVPGAGELLDTVPARECRRDLARLLVIADRWPEPELEVELAWTTPGLPDERRPRGTGVDLHLLRRGGDFFTAPFDCWADSCDYDWGARGPVDDPGHRALGLAPWRSGGGQVAEVERLRSGLAPYRIGVQYTRRFDVDGYDFGPSYATVSVRLDGARIWPPEDQPELGGRVLSREGEFWEPIQIRSDGTVEIVDRVRP